MPTYCAMPTPCEDVSKCAFVTFEKRGDVVITVGVDVVDDEPDYFMNICIRDFVGHQHVMTRGGTALLLIERMSRILRLGFDAISAKHP